MFSLRVLYTEQNQRQVLTSTIHIQALLSKTPETSTLKPQFKTTHGLFEQDKDRLPLSSPMSY
jgi:hypothetical protein